MTVYRNPSSQGPSHQGEAHDLSDSFKFRLISLGLPTAGLTDFNYPYFSQSKISLIIKKIIVLCTTKKKKHVEAQCFLIT